MKTYSISNGERYFSAETFKLRLQHWGAGSMNRKKELLAEAIGVSKDTVDGWASGRHSPKDLEGVSAVASMLGLEANDLLSPAIQKPNSGKETPMTDIPQLQFDAAQRTLHAFQKFYAIADETNGFIFDKYPLACLPFNLGSGFVSDRFYYCNDEFDPDFISGGLLMEQAHNQLRRTLEAEYLSLDRDLFWALLDHFETGIIPIPFTRVEKGRGDETTLNEEVSDSDELWLSTALGIRQAKAEMYRIFDEYFSNETSYGDILAVPL